MTFYYHLFILSCMFLFPILGYNVVFGRGKILYFGQIAQSLMSGYTLWVLHVQLGWSFLPSFLCCIAASFALGAVLATLALRLDEDAFGVMSIALHLIAIAVILNWQSVTRGALGIPRIPRGVFPSSIEGYALVTLVIFALWVFVLWLFERSRYGRALTALSEHKWYAQSLGVSRTHMYHIAFALAAVGSIGSSLLYPPYVFLLSPTDYFFPSTVFFVMIVVAGKPGSLWGVTLAGFLLVALREGLRFVDLPPDILGPLRVFLFGFILFVGVWVRRDSLFPPERKV